TRRRTWSSSSITSAMARWMSAEWGWSVPGRRVTVTLSSFVNVPSKSWIRRVRLPRKLFGQRDRAFSRGADFLDVGLDRLGVAGFLGDELAVVDDHREQVAEFVSQRAAWVFGEMVCGHRRFTSFHRLTSPSRSYPSSSRSDRAIARPRPSSCSCPGISRDRCSWTGGPESVSEATTPWPSRRSVYSTGRSVPAGLV